MNDPISWDPSLVKKFSSSNHYKLLNQLRNEVKKYPLNNKKKSSSIESRDTKLDPKEKSIVSTNQNSSFINTSKPSDEVNSNKSTISFNNSKNFSIYNQTNNNNVNQNESITTDKFKSNDVSSFTTFNERLNQIDMK